MKSILLIFDGQKTDYCGQLVCYSLFNQKTMKEVKVDYSRSFLANEGDLLDR